MNTLDLKKLGVQEMNAREMVEVEGGKVPGWMKKLGWGYVATEIIDNWDEIKQGLSDGWNLR